MPSDDQSPNVVVANPGSLAWMVHGASGLARAGRLRRYLTTIAPDRHDPGVLRILPQPISRAVERELRRRTLPAALPRDRVRKVVKFAEVANIIAWRAPFRVAIPSSVSRWRGGRFDRAVARHLRAGDQAAVVAWGSALSTLREAKRLGVRTYLDFPVAHHRFAERLLTEEARLQPLFARTLAYHDLPRGAKAQLDAEIELADRVLVLSRFHRQTFIDEGIDPGKLVINPFGVDLGLFQFAPEPRNDRFRVVFVGQVSQRKGLSYAVEGFRRAGIPDSELLLIGPSYGPWKPWRGVPGVREVSAVPPSSLPGLYASAHATCLPSLVEGLARVLLESLACGTPVIATPNSGVEDLITDGKEGHIVPIRDADSIAERLRAIHDRPVETSRMRAAARRAAERFSWSAYGDRLVAAVDQSGSDTR